MLDPHELAAGKLAALLARSANRDIFDGHRLLVAPDLVPEHLSDDAAMQAIIRDHPGLKWKALNVRKRLGVAAGDGEPTE